MSFTPAVDWDAVKTTIAQFIAACGVVDGGELIDGVSDPLANIQWEADANALTYGDIVALSISGETTVGTDDVEEVETEPDSGIFTPRITAHEEFVLHVKFNSRSQQTAARNAISRIRASLHHPQRRAILDDAGIGFLTTEMQQTLDAFENDRFESIGLLDVRMSVTSTLYEPEADAPIGYLQSVGMSINDSDEETIAP